MGGRGGGAAFPAVAAKLVGDGGDGGIAKRPNDDDDAGIGGGGGGTAPEATPRRCWLHTSPLLNPPSVEDDESTAAPVMVDAKVKEQLGSRGDNITEFTNEGGGSIGAVAAPASQAVEGGVDDEQPAMSAGVRIGTRPRGPISCQYRWVRIDLISGGVQYA
jgi:hypothetical protein